MLTVEPQPHEQPRQPTGSAMKLPAGTALAVPNPTLSKAKGSGGKLVAVALLVAMGAGVYHYQDQLREIWERTMPPSPVSPPQWTRPMKAHARCGP